MIFNIKDVKSWATRHDVKVGDEGYFFSSIDAFRYSEKEHIVLEKGKLFELRDAYASCFLINRDLGIKAYEFFIPLDKVKEEKKYRPFKDTYELYKFFMPDEPITCRKKNEPSYITIEAIYRIDFNATDKACKTYINNRDFEDWFDHCEIMNNEGKWQPFGAVETIGK